LNFLDRFKKNTQISNSLKFSQWEPSCSTWVNSQTNMRRLVIYTGHAPVRGHLYTVGMFDGDPICSFCGMEAETVQHIICCCEALAGQRYDVFGRLTVGPKDISTASVRDLCLFI